jgi:hypothetical protein
MPQIQEKIYNMNVRLKDFILDVVFEIRKFANFGVVAEPIITDTLL